MDRTVSQERAMRTTTQKLMLQGGLILLGALIVSSIGGWARRATADDQPAPLTAPALIGELRSLEQSLEATRTRSCASRYSHTTVAPARSRSCWTPVRIPRTATPRPS